MRTTASDEMIILEPPRPVTLELGLEYIEDDELIEVTPVVPAVAQTRAARVGTPQTRASRGRGRRRNCARTAIARSNPATHNLSWGDNVVP